MTSWNDYSGNKQGWNLKLILPIVLVTLLLISGVVVLVQNNDSNDSQDKVEAIGSIFTSTTSPAQAAEDALQGQLEGEGTTDDELNAALSAQELGASYPQAESGLTTQRFEEVRRAMTGLTTAYGLGTDRARYGDYFAPGEPVWARDMTIDFVYASAVDGRTDLFRGFVAWHGTSYLNVGIDQMQQSAYFSVGQDGALDAVAQYRLPAEIIRNDQYLDGRWFRPGTTRAG